VKINPHDVDTLAPQERALWPWLLAALIVALVWWVAK